ncbi:MAG: polysaccharide deacetylase family protein [Acidimicrobiia bacterium]
MHGARRNGPGAAGGFKLIAAGTGAAWLAHSAPYATAITPLRRRLLPGLSGMGPRSQVALTFDDGPDSTSTPLFLAELDRLGWRATFFVLPEMCRANRGALDEVMAAGHDIGVHGLRHRTHISRGPRDVADDIRRATLELEDMTGRAMQWFRPPHGTLTMSSALAARRMGLRTVLWTTWGRDWTATATPRSVTDHVLSHLEPGGTILLHDCDCTSSPGAWRSALGALALIADEIASRDLRVVSLNEHLDPPASPRRRPIGSQ